MIRECKQGQSLHAVLNAVLSKHALENLPEGEGKHREGYYGGNIWHPQTAAGDL